VGQCIQAVKQWTKYCREYNACGERFYFVKDNWYEREYVPRCQEHHRDRLDERRDEQGDDRRGLGPARPPRR
jgi:hypothetical protein